MSSKIVKEEGTTLLTVADGAAFARFEHELQKVIENVLDVNTEAQAVREIVLKVSFMPDEHRELAATVVRSSVKLAPLKAVSGRRVYFGKDAAGRLRAVDFDPKQPALFEETNVRPIREVGEKE